MRSILKSIIFSLCVILLASMMVSSGKAQNQAANGGLFNFQFSKVVELDDTHTPVIGQLSKDGLSLYVTMDENFKNQLYVMKRNKLSEEFGQPVKLGGDINSAEYNITNASVSADEKTIIFVSSADNTQRANDLYTASRESADEPFTGIRKLSEISDEGVSDAFPWLSPDGLRVYFTKQQGRNIELYSASRTNPKAEFIALRKIEFELPFVNNNTSCVLSQDEKEMYIVTKNLIYHSSREKLSEDFSGLQEVAQTDPNSFINSITMAPDKRELYVFNCVGFKEVDILKFDNPRFKTPVVTQGNPDEDEE